MAPQQWDDLKLWYDHPAGQWTEALPIGNGRFGAMVFGGVEAERLQLNEDTFWSGGPKPWNNPHALEVLPRVRELVFAGKYQEADQLCREMHGPFNESYQPLGDLRLAFEHAGSIEGYRRDLDLDREVATVRYTSGRATFTREAFASFPDQATIVRITCDQPGRISFTATLDSAQRFQTRVALADTLVMTGKAPSYVEPSYIKSDDPIKQGDEGMTFDVRLRAIAEGGNVTTRGAELHVDGADAVTLILAADTSFNGYLRSPSKDGKDPAIESVRDLEAAAGVPYGRLLERHVADHRGLFRRVSIDLGLATTAAVPTDDRVRRFHQSNDPQLAALLFQFGRYLLIASSRPGTQPANLQGIWNDLLRPPWSSNYTLNINAQMNYWPAESCNLSECHEPLLRYIGELAENGKETARIDYGCRGWVAHHNADLWRHSGPVGGGWGNPFWANWVMGGVWLCQHLWEHYAFTLDRDWLRDSAWPVMKSAALFCLDWLIEDRHGHLVTNPSVSPEHAFMTADGLRCECSVASTMDMALIRELFTHCISASEAMGSEREFAEELSAARARLFSYQVGARGQLQEWFQDFADREVHHRHVSHLFGLHPGAQITPRSEPALAAACKRSLEIRGDGGTGWALGWKINLWARLLDGEHAYALVRNLITPAGSNEVHMEGGGLYPNLFDAHPPFQIDGNFAFTAGVAEVLVQSHADEVELLPALPPAWRKGSVSGLLGGGGFEVSLVWDAGRLTRAVVRSSAGRPLRVRLGDLVRDFSLAAGATLSLDGKLDPVSTERT